jgi:arylsulfatase
MKKKCAFWVLTGVAGLLLSACSNVERTEQHDAKSAVAAGSERPNILLIVADDLGFTDLGAYGGEINTPNLDQLANDGLLLNDFHNQAVCAPTRAAILSGSDNHNAGGAMHQAANQRDVPGYESYLNEDVVAFPALLQQSGYNTYWAGKWHLGSEAHQTPNARGFDRSFALMEGGASHYEDSRGMFERSRVAHYVEDGVPVEKLPKGFYSSNFYTDYIINAIDSGKDSNEPWFAYLAFTAPHWPLQAPSEYIAKYKGKYDEGYQVLRANRIAKAKELGVIPESAQMYPHLERVPTWDSLSAEEKAISSKEMEIFAAMVELVDENVGRLIDHLKASGDYDNTLIMFVSDNGAEGSDRNPGDNGTDWTFDNSFENMGLIGSHIYYGAEWAQAGVGVGRYYKSYSSEGGTRGPAIIHHPKQVNKGQISDAFASVVDIAPTFLELAGVTHPDYGFNGRPLQPIQGESLVPMVFDGAESVRPDDFTFGWEVFGHRAIRKGDWKLLWLTSTPAERAQPLVENADNWGLYNVAVDPGEVNDLSAEHPELVAELLEAWDDYVSDNGVVLPVR